MDIICVGQTTWEGNYQKAVVQLMNEFAARHRVLYVDYQYTLKDLLTSAAGQGTAPVQTLLGRRPALTVKTDEKGREVYVWQPPAMLPINFLPPALHDQLLKVNVAGLVGGLQAVMRQLNMTHPVVINGLNPVFGLPMLGQLNEAATVYYCFDEITLLRWMSRHGSRYEPDYLRAVDAVVTTSETLRQSKAATQPNTVCIKNGVNFDLFSQARHYAPPPSGSRPVVGYLGTADDRVNADLVAHCARTLPDVLFRFIGGVTNPALLQLPAQLPNVELTPSRRPADLPPLLAELSAAIIPFQCNPHTYTIYPLKINEYLAAGLPVVATPFSILDDFRNVIELADTPDAFVQALRHALADTSPERVMGRVALARQNTWEERAKAFEDVLEEAVARQTKAATY